LALSVNRAENCLNLMQPIDPYQASAGPELDAVIHYDVLGKPVHEAPPRYSTDLEHAEELKRFIEAQYGSTVISGQTSIRGKRWFARYEIDPGNPTEVLAETYALAISRLALLRMNKR
jgi:hypothetical protein